MFYWASSKVALYILAPVGVHLCTSAGSSAGIYVATRAVAYAGRGIAKKIYNLVVPASPADITVTMSNVGTYIMHNGKLIQVDPRVKYILVNGVVHYDKDAIIVDTTIDPPPPS